jgi:hypothetical protein
MRRVETSSDQLVLVTSFREVATVLGLSGVCIAGAVLLLLPEPSFESWCIGIIGPVVGSSLLALRLRFVKWTFTRGQDFMIESTSIRGRQQHVIKITDVQTVSVKEVEGSRGRLRKVLVVRLSGDRSAVWESDSAEERRTEIAEFLGID